LLIEFALPITVLVASVPAFVNGVEALGERLGLTRFATGALLAAVLTALPETIIALMSPFHEAEGAREEGLSSVIVAPSITLF
jgi:cation:H+ antiporter